jgi:hypothetical protein
MLESTPARSALLHAMSQYLVGKSGPLRIERIPGLAFGIEWSDLSSADRVATFGIMKRLGFRQQGKHWFRMNAEPRPVA